MFPPLPGVIPPLPSLDFSAGPSNAASSSPITAGGINAPFNSGSQAGLLPIALIAAAYFFFIR